MKINTSIRKKFRIRNKLKKVSRLDRFRLSISRSANNISAQIIDDSKNVTILSASSKSKSLIILFNCCTKLIRIFYEKDF